MDLTLTEQDRELQKPAGSFAEKFLFPDELENEEIREHNQLIGG